MIQSTSYLFDHTNILDFDWVIIDHQFSSDLLTSSTSKQLHIFSLRHMLSDPVHKHLAFLTENKHPALSECNLLNFGPLRQVLYRMQILSIAISHTLHLDRSELRFGTHVQFALLIDIRLMVPSKGNIDDIWLVLALELLNLFRSEVAIHL